MCRRFLWSGQVEDNRANKVAWSTVCTPKEQGGLGLRDIKLMNKVLLLKLAWRLHTKKDTLWIAWTHEHYLKDAWFWSVIAKPSDSWIWKSILNLRPLVRMFLRSKVGNGESTSFWHDRWLQDHVLIQYATELTPLRSGIPINSSVAAAFDLHPWDRRANRTRAQDVKRVWDILNSYPNLHLNHQEDTWIWSQNRAETRLFTTSYTWASLTPLLPIVIWHKCVWFKGNIPKYAFLFWLAIQNKLAVKERLYQWKIVANPMCTFCGRYVEDRDHILLSCDYSEDIWRRVMMRLCGFACSFMDWGSLITWLISNSPNTSKGLKRLAAHITISFIWRERNSRVFNNISLPPATIFLQIDRAVKDALLARRYKKHFVGLLQHWFRWE